MTQNKYTYLCYYSDFDYCTKTSYTYYIGEYNVDDERYYKLYELNGNLYRNLNELMGIKGSYSKTLFWFDSLQEAVDYASKKIDICPAEGAFYGYKKAILARNTLVKGTELVCENGERIPIIGGDALETIGECIITLMIPAEALRTGCYYEPKCRAEYAKVVKIEQLDESDNLTEVPEDYFGLNAFWYSCDVVYRLGKMVYADSFDGNKEVACSNGIHFFLNKDEAIEYLKRG